MLPFPLTWLLIGVTVLVSWQAFEKPRLLDRLLLWPPAIDRSRQYDRLVTHGFVLFYLSAVVVAMLPTYLRHRHDPNYRSLGASGAVSAVLFVFILAAPWSMIFVFFLPVPAIVYGVFYVGYSIWMDKHGGDNVNHSAHLWGAGYGVLFTVMMEPRVVPYFLSQLVSPSFG